MTQGIRTINAATATDKAALARIHRRELGALFAERPGTASAPGIRVYESGQDHCIIVRFEAPIVTWACARSAAWFADFNELPRVSA